MNMSGHSWKGDEILVDTPWRNCFIKCCRACFDCRLGVFLGDAARTVVRSYRLTLKMPLTILEGAIPSPLVRRVEK